MAWPPRAATTSSTRVCSCCLAVCVCQLLSWLYVSGRKQPHPWQQAASNCHQQCLQIPTITTAQKHQQWQLQQGEGCARVESCCMCAAAQGPRHKVRASMPSQHAADFVSRLWLMKRAMLPCLVASMQHIKLVLWDGSWSRTVCSSGKGSGSTSGLSCPAACRHQRLLEDAARCRTHGTAAVPDTATPQQTHQQCMSFVRVLVVASQPAPCRLCCHILSDIVAHKSALGDGPSCVHAPTLRVCQQTHGPTVTSCTYGVWAETACCCCHTPHLIAAPLQADMHCQALLRRACQALCVTAARRAALQQADDSC